MTARRPAGTTPMEIPLHIVRGRYAYLAMAIYGMFFLGMFLLERAYHMAAFFGIEVALAVCGFADLSGYRNGFTEGARRAKKDAEAALDALDAEWIAMERPCEISIDPLPALPGEGFVYVITFSTGVVKVGQTIDLRRRFAEHRRDAEAYNVVITNYWVSCAHVNYLDNEIELIGFCDGFGARAKREYFHDINFDVVVRFAVGLTYSASVPTVTEVDR